MKLSKIKIEEFKKDFYKTFTNIDMNAAEIDESVSAIWGLIQIPIYNNKEDCHYAQMPFGIELKPQEHAVIPLGIECDTKDFMAVSDNPKYTVETVTQTGDIFIHIENVSNELISFEPDQVFCKLVSNKNG